MKKTIITTLTGTIGTSVSAFGTWLQTNEFLETISLLITIIGGVITFIVMPILNWYKHAKKDGKITKEEVEEVIEIVNEGIEEIKDETKGGK